MNTLHAIFDWLSAASFRASLLTIAVFLLQAALRRHLTARMRYALWLPVLIVLLMPVFPQSRWSVETVFAKPPQPVQITSVPIDFSPGAPPVDHSPPLPQPEPIDWQRIFIMAWLTGASGILLFGSISFIITLRRFKRSRHPVSDELTITLAQTAREVRLRRVPCVWIASAIHSPAVTGLLRPVLLLPSGFDRDFTADEKRLILQHELMHLKRGDLPLNTLLCVLMALHWFNPLLWLAFFKARADRETACDAQVLRNATQQRRSEYGHALLKVEAAFAPLRLSLGFVGMLQRGATLRARIRAITTPSRTRPLTGLFVVLCISGMTFLGITRAENATSEEKPDLLVGIEIKIVHFNKPTDWNFGGRLLIKNTDSFASQSLSRTELMKLMRELALRKDEALTSYPRMVTTNGTEVIIRSVVNQPFEEAKGKVAYMPVGFVLKLTPTLEGGRVVMPTHISESNIVTHEPLVVSSRLFQSTLEADEGFSHIVGTWEDGKAQSRRPVLYIVTPTRIQVSDVGLAEMSGMLFGEALKEADELRRASPKAYEMSKKALGEVLQLLATDAGIHFTNLPEDHPSSKKLITFSIRASPFKVLETMCEANGLKLGFDQGLWQVHPSVIETKLQTIVLPRVQFRGASIEEAVEYLHAKSREFDTLDKTGVQFILRPGVTKTGRISLDLKDVPLIEALRYCTELAGLTYKVEPYAVVIGAAKAEVPAKLEMTAKSDAKATVTTRASKIILPNVEFRDATLVEAIEFIRAKSREHDPDKKGVNILIKGDGSGAKITLSLKNVPVSEALRYCAELSDHKLTSDAQSFLLTPVSEASPEKDDQAATPPARPAEEAAAAQAAALRNAPKQRYEFTKAKLGDVLRLLATDAGINLFALADDNPVNQRLMTYAIHSSPFSVLETLCKANGLVLVLDQDRWFIRAADDLEQIGKSYVLPQTQTSVETVADDPRQVAIGYPIPQTKASVDTILKDIGSILAGGETKPVAGNPQPSVQFKKEQNSVYVKATRLQHTWVSGYLQALGSSAQSRNTK